MDGTQSLQLGDSTAIDKYDPQNMWSCRICHHRTRTEISLSELLSAPRGLTCTGCCTTHDALAVFEPAVRRDLEASGLGPVWPGLDKVVLNYSTYLEVELIYRLGEGNGFDLRIPLDVFVEAGSRARPGMRIFYPSYNIPGHLNLTRAVSVASKWIMNCNKLHPHCSVPHSPVLPTRVLDLGPPGAVDDVRLKIPDGERAQYIALSYCWGQKATQGATLTTTTATLPNHLAGISWNTIPHTFRDAIRFCWGLGIQYLWIDALCIIQDDDADWEEQAALMAQVYERSFLTVAATACPDNETGLFTARKTHFQNCPFGIKAHSAWTAQGSPKQFEVFIRPQLHVAHDRFRNGDNAKEHAADSPLLTRAWSFQERLLPRRVIHFHAEELVWECRTGMRCECGELNSPDSEGELIESSVPSGTLPENPSVEQGSLSSHDYCDNNGWNSLFGIEPSLAWLKSSLTWAISRADTELSPENLRHLSRIWLDLVSEYMQLDLTYEKDRMPAISGLAASFSRPELGRSLAGVWESALPEGFLFKVQHLEPTNISAHHEPSSSWAASCCITVRGLLGDCRELITQLEHAAETDDGLGAVFYNDRRFEVVSKDESGSPRISCLQIITVSRYTAGPLGKRPWSYGLVLQEVTGEDYGADTYRRLGVLIYTKQVSRSFDSLRVEQIRLV